jgi:lipopolysaccharide/colanic/teichoic acid biosynthesis glycosyltransferase
MASTAYHPIPRRLEKSNNIGGWLRSLSAISLPAILGGAALIPQKAALQSSEKYSVAHDPSALRQASKRSLDILIAGFALIALLPVMATLAVAIKLESKGPVFFRQLRYGRGGKLFWIFKFRTMYADTGDFSGVHQTVRDDPRVTPMGHFLRRMNLDEIPQLLNILKGEMSFVGPRPQVPGQLAGGMKYEYLVPYYFERHMVRPGLTGLAQVNNCRGSTTEPQKAIQRIDFDLDYIECWSLALDFKIIVRTIMSEFVLGRRGGY